MDASSAPQIIEHLSHSVDFTPFDTKWVPMSARIAVVGCYAKGTGVIQGTNDKEQTMREQPGDATRRWQCESERRSSAAAQSTAALHRWL